MFESIKKDETGGWKSMARIGLAALVILDVASAFAPDLLNVHAYIAAWACGVYLICYSMQRGKRDGLV
jgi:hypothetical protein